MILKKVSWFFKRHHFLYITRFKLLSKNASIAAIQNCSYNEFNLEKDIPKDFKKINAIIFKEAKPALDLPLVKQLSIWLYKHIKGGPGLSAPSDKALQIMLAGKGGVCSDMAQIFNNFCVINRVLVREWGTTRAPFNKEYGGHSFNEVFIKELNKWVLIDVYGSLLFYDEGSVPLSVIELYQRVRAKKKILFKSFAKDREVDNANVIKNYLDPNTTPFLICNYSNKTYDSFLGLFRPHIPVFIIHFMVFLLGKSYHYRFPLDNYKKIYS
ncbi:hypothetical protein KO494_08545 [Lacinutrix sp. C3R15]|uniref:hypothetical protein n=1 Tax=Flavobacteriaceae TaxID=49546 RepID=UPI001C0A6682|nr:MULTISPECIES: hypothetical protein [Flavobacteriaceae]MBU2939589.1 hypothetical protein [Lacinutrix sp. C3R15]MDO6622903.1 hypothetical protein [Oceanihabitans sp. 1_MG-2023]